MTDKPAIGDAVRIISRQRTGTIERISDGIAIIRTDDNISHFTAAFLTDLEPNAMKQPKIVKLESPSGKPFFMVHWNGYASAPTTWESEAQTWCDAIRAYGWCISARLLPGA